MIVCGLISLRAGGIRGPAAALDRSFGGALVIIVAFVWDFRNTTAGGLPNPFNWPLFLLGEAIGLSAFLRCKLDDQSKNFGNLENRAIRDRRRIGAEPREIRRRPTIRRARRRFRGTISTPLPPASRESTPCCSAPAEASRHCAPPPPASRMAMASLMLPGPGLPMKKSDRCM